LFYWKCREHRHVAEPSLVGRAGDGEEAGFADAEMRLRPDSRMRSRRGIDPGCSAAVARACRNWQESIHLDRRPGFKEGRRDTDLEDGW
jgi:hypothetical protein